jgi:hypothetical protein
MVMGADTDASSGGTVYGNIEEDEGIQSNNPQGIPEEGLEEDIMNMPKKSDIPASQRKEKGGDWKVTNKDLEKEKERNISGPEGMKALQKRLGQISEEQVEEDLDANQKRAGQLGPTEKITKSNPLRGKLVGANESVEQEVEEGIVDKIRAKNYDRLANRSINKATNAMNRATDYDFDDLDNREEHEDEFMRQMKNAKQRQAKSFMLKNLPNVKEGVAEGVVTTPGVAFKQGKVDPGQQKSVERDGKLMGKYREKGMGLGSALDRLDKFKQKHSNEGVAEGLNEMDSEGYKGSRDDYEIGKGKEGKGTPMKGKDVAKKAGKALNKAMDKAHKKDVKEGQEDLDAILRIIRK